MVLTPERKQLINKLTTEGKSPVAISKIMGLNYSTVYNFVNKSIRCAGRNVQSITVKSTVPVKVIISGREMPPIYTSELKIIASKELAELACQQMGLKPPVTTLAERPRSYNANGWARINNKWVAGTATTNDGMLKKQPVFRATNGFVQL